MIGLADFSATLKYKIVIGNYKTIFLVDIMKMLFAAYTERPLLKSDGNRPIRTHDVCSRVVSANQSDEKVEKSQTSEIS